MLTYCQEANYLSPGESDKEMFVIQCGRNVATDSIQKQLVLQLS